MPAISPSNADVFSADALHGPGLASPAALWRWPAVLLGMVAGALLQLLQATLWSATLYGTLLGVALFAGALGPWWPPIRQQGRRGYLVAMVSTALALGVGALGVFAATGWRASVFTAQALDPALEGQSIRVTGMVAAMPQVNEAGTRLRLQVEAAHLNGALVRLPPVVDVAWYSGVFGDASGVVDLSRQAPVLRAGERWSMTVRLKAPHGLRNPYGFDYELWVWEQGVQASGSVRVGLKDDPPVRLATTWQYPVEQLRQHVRDAIFDRLGRTSEDSEPGRPRIAGVVAALVTGDQRAIDRADWDVFRATGVAHLMSISGLHITLFAWLAAWGVGALWRRSARLCLAVPAPSAGLVAGVLLAMAYAIFSGWGVPAQRTVLMLAVIALLQLSGRRWPWPQVWLLACAAVVLVDPWALAQAGFWLSFVAVGVLFSTNFATNSVADSAYKISARGRFYALLREQWVVTLALTPLSLLLFGQISVVGFAANVLAIPWVTLVVTPLALGGLVWSPLWSLAALSLQPLTAVLQWLAQWPWAVLFLPAAPLWAGAAGVLGGALLAMRLPWPLRVLALPLLVPVLWWQPARPAVGQFELLAADIGQGNAVLVRTAQHTLLYDTGPRFSRESDAGHRVLVPLLRALGERIDLLVLSHRDADHTGGAAAVLAQQPQAEVTGSIEADHPLQSARPVKPCVAGQRWEWDGVVFEMLHPLAGADAPAPTSAATARPAPLIRPNALSCVLRIAAREDKDHEGAVALLVGDIEAPQEQALIARNAPSKLPESEPLKALGAGPNDGLISAPSNALPSALAVALPVASPVASPAVPPRTPLQADLLLVPHHGSKTSSSQAFLAAVQPRTALVQAGYRNRFGHPAPEVLQRYRALGIQVIESPRCGAATWSSAAPAAVTCERDTARRYWQHTIPDRAD